MRHGNKINKLGRNAEHRRALLRNLACALFVNGYIQTTQAKAKALKPYAEKIITKAVKVNKALSLSERLALIRNIRTEINIMDAYIFLVSVWGVLCLDRPGGYLRIIKTPTRVGDASEMAFIGIVVDEYYVEKYNLKDKSYDALFFELAKKLLSDIFPIKKILTYWGFAQMPKININISMPRNKNSVSFEIYFSTIGDLEEAYWPIYNGQYSNLPLRLEVDYPDSHHLNCIFSPNDNMKEIPTVFPKNNVFKTKFTPTKKDQTITGKIMVESKDIKITALAYCELIIYGPIGRIFCCSLLDI